MTNKEFQKLSLEELRSIKNDISGLKEGQNRIGNKLDAVYNQTVNLTEFRIEASMKLDNIIEDNKSIREMLGEHEISIRTLRRKPV